MEASLYAVPQAFVKHEAERGTRAAKILLRFKRDIGKPIATILIINTVANTAGASVAGWAAGKVFGSQYLAIFSALFTLVILYFSEIIPKLVGVMYSKRVALAIALPLSFLVKITRPLVWVSELLSGRIKKREGTAGLSAQEFLSMAALGTEQGALDHLEGSVIANVVGLDQLLVRDVLTPRVVVFRQEEETPLASIAEELLNWSYSRVPLYRDENHDHLTGYVTQRDLYRELLRGPSDKRLRDFARPLKAVPELQRVDKLLLQMFEDKELIAAVVDEHGGLAGIITLEDVIEEIVGREIVDEYDTVSDLRSFAKLLGFARHRQNDKPLVK